ncbi:MAG: MBL fold metallo-hydrolase [Cyanobacteria bacterium J055]|nr:MAG: MBL fold metallo-hydrolase [Cyanobacteria bacterium J055]
MDLECLPYGAGHEDEGICVWLRMGPHRILLDCGLRDISVLLGEQSRLRVADLVLCSNANADRARGLLYLHRAAPSLPIFASEVTAQLLPLNWLDETEVPAFCQGLPWRSPVELQEDLWVELFPAGHLPGGSLLRLTYSGGDYPCTVVYTGDFLLSNSRLVDGLPLEELRALAPDVLIVEGSYGTARYPRRRTQENQLAERIERSIATRESVLLPVSPLGLAQELLMLLRSHHHFTGRDLDIWVDDTIAAGCDAYLQLLPHFPTAVQNFARHQPLFWDDRIRPRMRRLTPEARSSLGKTPAIVLISAESEVSPYCQRGSWMILLQQQPGYPSAEDNLEVASSASIKIETYLLSEHCDVAGTTQLIHNLRPQHVAIVRGSPAYLADLSNLEELRNRYQLHCPASGTLVELPLREKFVPSELTETQYEGEISEHEWGVAAILPAAIAADARWQQFADTGVIETRWQGDELVLRGISQRELLERGRDRPIPAEAPFCANCTHYRAGQCWNQASPLWGFKVAPDGSCPVFEGRD